MKKTEKEIVDTFAKNVGVMVSWCEGCKVWTLHCPSCGANYCGSGCDCGYNVFMERQTYRLDKALEMAKN